MESNINSLIGKRVQATCYVFKRGKKQHGVITGIKESNTQYTTLYVLFDGNRKSTSIGLGWCKIIA